MMPGKVKPVVPEMMIQAAYQVMGNDTTATLCGQGGILELNTAMSMMAHAVLRSIDLLGACQDFSRQAALDVEVLPPEKTEELFAAVIPPQVGQGVPDAESMTRPVWEVKAST